MTETKQSGDKTLTVGPAKTLSLKRPVEQGMVRQSFSHGRTKAVVVEKVKTRTIAAPGKPAGAPPAAAPTQAAPASAQPAAPSAAVEVAAAAEPAPVNVPAPKPVAPRGPTARGSAPGGPQPRSA
jgi:translation initiation factor IF-2